MSVIWEGNKDVAKGTHLLLLAERQALVGAGYVYQLVAKTCDSGRDMGEEAAQENLKAKRDKYKKKSPIFSAQFFVTYILHIIYQLI